VHVRLDEPRDDRTPARVENARRTRESRLALSPGAREDGPNLSPLYENVGLDDT
jgi:hypothetical protein